MDIRYRPLDAWPGDETPAWKRKRAPFSAGWRRTLEQLVRELEHLRATGVLFLVDVPPEDFRSTDGHPKARARWGHPGVVISFDSKHGPLKYATDVFDTFADNVRAVALGLEALRRVERYGIVKRGEQYRGWSALPPATVMGAPLNREEAARVLADLSGVVVDASADAQLVESAYRRAVKIHHPDTGGDADMFRRATEARAALIEGNRT